MDNKIALVIGIVALALGGWAVLKPQMLGSVPGVTLYPTTSLENTITWAPTSSTTAMTVSHAQSGSTFLLSASGTTITLPALRDELSYKFVVNGALDSANVVIASAEGDNIDGTLIVAGAVVDCRGEDFINFVTDGEADGDYVEIYSDGSQWLIGDSGVLTTAKMTCTDPS